MKKHEFNFFAKKEKAGKIFLSPATGNYKYLFGLYTEEL
jgi:hypothetical protein